ncbi:squalene cyclase [Microbacterium fluvii]|uniref:Squalene cyclase n=1 Tax=Microbacterium fluvii TaxID=415215 RepID=A0ABW2HHK7_9MICO|nr:squalene cyclase [Microbacterium fluvii]MCU4672946.1 squalene cyclase [Microbacterium fluvii]
MTTSADDLLPWLLDSDPALRWQVERDLVGAAPEQWQATRARVATEGFGAALLARQDADGQWANGAFFPGDDAPDEARSEHPDGRGQPWTATTWSLNSLREWGTDAAALAGTVEKLAANCRWEYDDLPYWQGEVDCCINGYTLATGAWLGADVSALAEWFPAHQLPEGGWNCEWEEGSTRSSFPSTLNALKGMLEWEQRTGSDAQRASRWRGQEFLLERRLLFRRTTGELFAPYATHIAYPFRAYYSALNAADYFRAASLHDGVAPDERISDAITAVREKRRPDGTWMQERRHPGAVWFEIDVPAGERSKWLTLIGTRVLDWWDAAH